MSYHAILSYSASAAAFVFHRYRQKCPDSPSQYNVSCIKSEFFVSFGTASDDAYSIKCL